MLLGFNGFPLPIPDKKGLPQQFATGSGSTGTSYSFPIPGGSNSYPTITVSGLKFTPKLILSYVNSTNSGYNYLTVYSYYVLNRYQGDWHIQMCNMQGSISVSANLGTNGYVDATGFRLPSLYSGSQYWIAVGWY
jgi:hypothetical protein